MRILKNDLKKVIVNTVVGLLVAGIIAIVRYYYLHPGTGYSFFVDNPFQFLKSIYFKYSVPMRLNLFIWLMTFFIYYILEKYDNKYEIEREIVRENFKSRTFIFYSISVFFGLIYISNTIIPTSELMSIIIDIVGILLSVLGFIIFIFGRVEIDGLWGPHLYKYSDPSFQKLITTGVFKRMRHPIYVGQFVLAVSTFVLSKSWLFLFFPILVGIINTFRASEEEKFLSNEFNDEYKEYKKNVKKWWLF